MRLVRLGFLLNKFPTDAGPRADALLLEGGDYILLESGDRILLE